MSQRETVEKAALAVRPPAGPRPNGDGEGEERVTEAELRDAAEALEETL